MKNIRFLWGVLAAAICLLPFSSVTASEPGFTEKVIKSASIVTDGWTIIPESLIASPDSQHIAGVARKDKKFCIVYDGKVQKAYDLILKDTPVFSPDSRHYAYVAKKGTKWFVVQDGHEHEGYDAVSIPQYSPDSKRTAYVAEQGGKMMAVIDGVKQTRYDIVPAKTNIRFSPDSKSVAYSAVKGKKMMVVLNGKEQKLYNKVSYTTFSADSRHLVYVAYPTESENKQMIVMDGVEGPIYEKIGVYAFSPDSNRFAYSAKKDGKGFMVVDGKEGPRFKDVAAPFFRPDSKQVTYLAEDNGKFLMVVDGAKGQRYDMIRQFSYSPDSAHYLMTVKKGSKWTAIIDGKEGPLYEDIVYNPYDSPFSPDSKHYAYTVKKGEKFAWALDGNVGPFYDVVYPVPLFSPDSKHFVYMAQKGKKWVVVKDGKESREYDQVNYPRFTPDSKHFMFMAFENDLWFPVVDGVEGKERLALILKGATIEFEQGNRISFPVTRSGSSRPQRCRRPPCGWMLTSSKHTGKRDQEAETGARTGPRFLWSTWPEISPRPCFFSGSARPCGVVAQVGPDLAQGLSLLPLPHELLNEVQPCLRAARVDFQRLQEAPLPLLHIALAHEGFSQTVPGAHMLRIELHRPAILPDRFVVIAVGAQAPCQGIVRGRGGRAQLDCLEIVGDCFLPVPQFFVGKPQVRVGHCIGRVHLERLVEVADGPFDVSPLVQGTAQVVVGQVALRRVTAARASRGVSLQRVGRGLTSVPASSTDVRPDPALPAFSPYLISAGARSRTRAAQRAASPAWALP